MTDLLLAVATALPIVAVVMTGPARRRATADRPTTDRSRTDLSDTEDLLGPTPLAVSDPGDGFGKFRTYASHQVTEMDLATLPLGSTAWVTPWSFHTDATGEFLPAGTPACDLPQGTARTRVMVTRSGIVAGPHEPPTTGTRAPDAFPVL